MENGVGMLTRSILDEMFMVLVLALVLPGRGGNHRV